MFPTKLPKAPVVTERQLYYGHNIITVSKMHDFVSKSIHSCESKSSYWQSNNVADNKKLNCSLEEHDLGYLLSTQELVHAYILAAAGDNTILANITT